MVDADRDARLAGGLEQLVGLVGRPSQGFSTKTSTPASAARSTASPWRNGGSATTAASRSSELSSVA